MDPRIFQVDLDYQLSNLVKQTTTQADTLNRFKQAFNKLSGKTVDTPLFEKIDNFKVFITETHKFLSKCKQAIERAMNNKADYDNSKLKLFEQMADLEELLAQDLGENTFRSE